MNPEAAFNMMIEMQEPLGHSSIQYYERKLSYVVPEDSAKDIKLNASKSAAFV